jgi:hypothetical protein
MKKASVKTKLSGKKCAGKFSILTMVAVILMLGLLSSSCTSKAMVRQKVLDKPLDDDYVARIDEIKKKRKALYGESVTNAFLFNMDVGVLFHYAGMYDSSNAYLQKAEEIYDELFTKSVSNEAAALLTNDNVRPYRSKPYELTVLYQLVALNFMAMGKFDESLVETRKMQVYFNEWERTVAKDKKYHTDGMFHLFSSLAYERVGEADNSLISLYHSVDAYKKGPVALAPEVEGFAYDRLKAGDRVDDINTLNLKPGDGHNRWSAGMGEEEIVIVGYVGQGPKMIELNWRGAMTPGGNLYISTKNRQGKNVTYSAMSPNMPESHRGKIRGGSQPIKVSLPELVTRSSRVDRFSAQLAGNDQVFESVVVNDIDLQSKKALSDDFAAIVARTVIRAVIRTISSNQIQKVDTGIPALNLIKDVGTMVAADQMEKADVRMCFMLPKRIIVTRIPVKPGVHSVKMNVHDRSGGIIGRKSFDNIDVKQGEKKVLFGHYFL